MTEDTLPEDLYATLGTPYDCEVCGMNFDKADFLLDRDKKDFHLSISIGCYSGDSWTKSQSQEAIKGLENLRASSGDLSTEDLAELALMSETITWIDENWRTK